MNPVFAGKSVKLSWVQWRWENDIFVGYTFPVTHFYKTTTCALLSQRGGGGVISDWLRRAHEWQQMCHACALHSQLGTASPASWEEHTCSAAAAVPALFPASRRGGPWLTVEDTWQQLCCACALPWRGHMMKSLCQTASWCHACHRLGASSVHTYLLVSVCHKTGKETGGLLKKI